MSMRSDIKIFSDKQGRIFLRSLPSSTDLAKPLLDADLQDARCRICQTQPDEPLLNPCWCAGSVQHVCPHCLNKWRGLSAKNRMSCELCGFAYLFEFERVPSHELVRHVVMHSWRSMVLLGCVTVCLFMLSDRVAVVMAPAQLLLVICVMCAFICDAYRSLGKPQFGSVRYSLMRLRSGSDAGVMDLWELHKVQWAQAGISPTEVDSTSDKSLCRPFLEVIGGMFCVTFMMVWVSLPPEFFVWFTSKYVETIAVQMCKPCLAVGFVYLLVVVLVHTFTLVHVPPLRLVTDSDAKPLVRNLIAYEKRSRIVPSP